jgi:hypothetical protein
MQSLSKDLDCVAEQAKLIRSDYRWSLKHVECDSERLCEALRVLPATEVDFWPTAQVLYDKLYLLLSELSLIPHSAITVHDDGRVREVVVFDTLVYRIDRQLKTITAGWLRDGCLVMENWDVGLLHPLSTSWWLHTIIKARGLSEIKAQKDLFISDDLMRERESWLVDVAYALLKDNPRFQKLRRKIRNALSHDMNRELVQIVLQVRHYRQREVSNLYYSTLWQHEEELRHVRRICPKAAPLMAIAILERRGEFSDEPLAALRDVLAGKGHLPPALWKCVITQGMSLFRAAWSCISAGGSRITAAINYLRLLGTIGVTASPPFSVIYAFLRYYSEFAHPGWTLDSNKIVYRIAFQQACRLSRTEVTEQFINSFLLICRWAEEVCPQLDRQQRKASWPWLLKRARAWERKKLFLSGHANAEWACPVPVAEYEEFVIYVLGNAEALIDEACAMHHCADDYIDMIEEGKYRLFSVRNRTTMERVATFSLMFYPDMGPIWFIHQIKGFANLPLEKDLYELGLYIMRLHNAPLLELQRQTRKRDPEALDVDLYQSVKPHFEVLLSTFAEVEKNRTHWFRELYRHYGPGILRYAGRFANEMKLASR